MEPAKRPVCSLCGRELDEKPTPAKETVTLTAPEGTVGAIGMPPPDEDDATPEMQPQASGIEP